MARAVTLVPLPWTGAQNHIGHRQGSAQHLVMKRLGAAFGIHQFHVLRFEFQPHGIRNHARAVARAGPWPPIDRNDAGLCPARAKLGCKSVQHLIRGGIIGLAGIAKPARDRGEDREERRRRGVKGPRQRERAQNLWQNNAVPAIGRFVIDTLVFDHARAVNDAVQTRI